MGMQWLLVPAVSVTSPTTVSIEGKVTNANYSLKKGAYIFFINNRLIDCHAIRKTIDAVYSEILPRHRHPFVYLNIR